MKKLISLFLALFMVMSCAPLTVLADEYYPRYAGNSGSIVDALNSAGADSSYSSREQIAYANGVEAESVNTSCNIVYRNIV